MSKKIDDWVRVYFKEPDYAKENLKGIAIVVVALVISVLLFIVLPEVIK